MNINKIIEYLENNKLEYEFDKYNSELVYLEGTPCKFVLKESDVYTIYEDNNFFIDVNVEVDDLPYNYVTMLQKDEATSLYEYYVTESTTLELIKMLGSAN